MIMWCLGRIYPLIYIEENIATNRIEQQKEFNATKDKLKIVSSREKIVINPLKEE